MKCQETFNNFKKLKNVVINTTWASNTPTWKTLFRKQRTPRKHFCYSHRWGLDEVSAEILFSVLKIEFTMNKINKWNFSVILLLLLWCYASQIFMTHSIIVLILNIHFFWFKIERFIHFNKYTVWHIFYVYFSNFFKENNHENL